MQEDARRRGAKGARRRDKELQVVEREARLERLRRTARRRLGVHIMPHVPDRYAFPTKVRHAFPGLGIRSFDRIDRFCDRKIDSIGKKIKSLLSFFFKVGGIDSIKINLFKSSTIAIRSWSIFFKDRKDLKIEDRKVEFPTLTLLLKRNYYLNLH